jgi:transposase
LIIQKEDEMAKDNVNYVGIDVGKTWLDVAVYGREEVVRIKNDEKGFIDLLELLAEIQPTLIAMEASGGYENGAVSAMVIANYRVSVVNPTRVRALAKAMGLLAKTDCIDAKLIAIFAQKIQPPAKEIHEKNEILLQSLVTRREQLVGIRSTEKNRVGTAPSCMKEDIINHIDWLTEQIKIFEIRIKEVLETLPMWKAHVERLDSIPGVGFITAVTVVVEMPELGTLSRQKIAALGGLAPYNKESGKKQGKRKIFGGRKAVRRVLYMACLSAMINNPVIKNMFQRLSDKGKPFKVAFTACMHKMLTIMNAMARDETFWHSVSSV